MKAISLCGGGSKGSYELGAWEALNELKISFDIATGTSIGALNSSMLVQGEYKRCEELWKKVSITSILSNGFEIDEVSVRSIVKHEDFKPFIKDYIKGYSNIITPFRNLLAEYVIPKKIKESKIRFGVIVTTFPRRKKVSVILSDLEDDAEIIEYLIASASAFPVFPVCKINDKQYIDGGFTDNLPINLAFDMGANHVVAVDLKMDVHHKEFVKHPCVDYIYPKWDLGSFLYFNPDVIARNRKLGYYDTMKYYDKFDGFRYTFVKTSKYDKLAILITTSIARDYIHYKEHKLKDAFKRVDYENIYSLLNEHIHKEIKINAYLLKCIESIGFIFEIAPNTSYTIKDFLSIILTKIQSVDCSAVTEEFFALKSDAKKREYMIECDKRLFISFLHNNDFDNKFKYFLLQSNPEMYLAYNYLLTLKVVKKKLK